MISLDKLQSKSYYQRKRKNDDNSFDIPFQRRAAIGSAQRVRTSKARNKNDKRNLAETHIKLTKNANMKYELKNQ